MLWRRAVLDGLARGEVTLAFRRWKRAPPWPGPTARRKKEALSREIHPFLERVKTPGNTNF